MNPHIIGVCRSVFDGASDLSHPASVSYGKKEGTHAKLPPHTLIRRSTRSFASVSWQPMITCFVFSGGLVLSYLLLEYFILSHLKHFRLPTNDSHFGNQERGSFLAEHRSMRYVCTSAATACSPTMEL